MKSLCIILKYFSLCETSRMRERLNSLNPSQRSGRGHLISGALRGTVAVAPAIALALLLSACPEGGGAGGGASGGPAGPPRYLCTNGTPVDGTTDATSDAGRTRCQRCNLFYKLNGAASALGTSCEQVAIGEATRIGNETTFGAVNENFPAGLAAIGATLYMVGGRNDVLYTLNIDPDDATPDGTAIQVGSLSGGFGVGETVPEGLTAIGATLYMVGGSNDRLYTLNIADDATPDGTAIQVGSLSGGFGVGITYPEDLAAINITLYMITSDDVLYTLNIADDATPDGTAIRVGTLPGGFGVGETIATSLGAIGNTLYMAGYQNEVLYTLDSDTGRATQVGSVSAGFGQSERLPEGLQFIEGVLYMVGSDNDALYALRYQ